MTEQQSEVAAQVVPDGIGAESGAGASAATTNGTEEQKTDNPYLQVTPEGVVIDTTPNTQLPAWAQPAKANFPGEPDTARTWGLGSFFCRWDDGFIQHWLMNYVDIQSKCALSACSRAWYCEASDPELWRKEAMKYWNFKSGRFPWKGKWKETALTMRDIYVYEMKQIADWMIKKQEEQKVSEEEKPKEMSEGDSEQSKDSNKDSCLPDIGVLEETEELRAIIDKIPYNNSPEPFSFDPSKPNYLSGFTGMLMQRRWYRANYPMDYLDLPYSHLERISAKTTTYEEFQEKYIKGGRPVLITDWADNWPAMKCWTPEALNERFGSTVFKMTHKHSRKRLRMRLNDYFKYWNNHHDNDPLYLFESTFAKKVPIMDTEYTVPEYFKTNLFDHLGDRMPFERWVISGPARTGTSFHVDPLMTSAWNALICGRKRWALYPPNWPTAPGSISYHPDDRFDSEVDPLAWFLEHYPFLAPEYRPWECVQRAGEIIFVPSGWWHLVLNLDNTVAVTHNFVNESNFKIVWDELDYMAYDEPEDDDDVILQKAWIESLKEHYPEQYKLVEGWLQEKKEQEERRKLRETDSQLGRSDDEESLSEKVEKVSIVPPLSLGAIAEQGPRDWVENPLEQIKLSSRTPKPEQTTEQLVQ